MSGIRMGVHMCMRLLNLDSLNSYSRAGSRIMVAGQQVGWVAPAGDDAEQVQTPLHWRFLIYG